MAKRRKKKGRNMTTNPDKPKSNSQYYGDEIIRVKKAKFVDGETTGQFLRRGGTKSTIRAGIKSGAIEIESPEATET